MATISYTITSTGQDGTAVVQWSEMEGATVDVGTAFDISGYEMLGVQLTAGTPSGTSVSLQGSLDGATSNWKTLRDRLVPATTCVFAAVGTLIFSPENSPRYIRALTTGPGTGEGLQLTVLVRQAR